VGVDVVVRLAQDRGDCERRGLAEHGRALAGELGRARVGVCAGGSDGEEGALVCEGARAALGGS
jgi:hypothetical protein